MNFRILSHLTLELNFLNSHFISTHHFNSLWWKKDLTFYKQKNQRQFQPVFIKKISQRTIFLPFLGFYVQMCTFNQRRSKLILRSFLLSYVSVSEMSFKRFYVCEEVCCDNGKNFYKENVLLKNIKNYLNLKK